MTTKYEIGGHLIDANGGRHLVVDTGDGPVSPVCIQWGNDATLWLSVTTLSMLRYEPPYKAPPMTRELEEAITNMIDCGAHGDSDCRENAHDMLLTAYRAWREGK